MARNPEGIRTRPRVDAFDADHAAESSVEGAHGDKGIIGVRSKRDPDAPRWTVVGAGRGR